MRIRKKYFITNMQKSSVVIFFLFAAFFAACSTPTVSSDDSDEGPEKVEQEDKSSSSGISSSKEASWSSSSEKKTESSSSAELSELSSNSADDQDCSTLLKKEKEDGFWYWKVPKECRFNPDIDYGSITDSRDGQVYKTVKIGEQTWMAENLNYADSIKTPSLLGKSWCYEDDPEKCAVAGRLYTWTAAIDSVALYDGGAGVDCGYYKTCSLPDTVHGICPSGWHLPNNMEWNTLLDFLGGPKLAGNDLRSLSGWYAGGNGTDSVGFSALPVGQRDGVGVFSFTASLASFWSVTDKYDGFWVYALVLGADDYYAYLSSSNAKNDGFSVRCLKD